MSLLSLSSYDFSLLRRLELIVGSSLYITGSSLTETISSVPTRFIMHPFIDLFWIRVDEN